MRCFNRSRAPPRIKSRFTLCLHDFKTVVIELEFVCPLRPFGRAATGSQSIVSMNSAVRFTRVLLIITFPKSSDKLWSGFPSYVSDAFDTF